MRLSPATIQKPAGSFRYESANLIRLGWAAQPEYALHVKATEQHAPKLLRGQLGICRAQGATANLFANISCE
jgi:hypothetical protein